jgi:hypothetical protein
MAQIRTRTALAPMTPRSAARRVPRNRAPPPVLSLRAQRCRAKFREYFPGGFYDAAYVDSERDYKWRAHQRWEAQLGQDVFRRMMRQGAYGTIAAQAIAIESRTNLLFSFEKMALRDAVRTPDGARAFATGLYDLLHGTGEPGLRFDEWCKILAALPRRQTRVLNWPIATVFGFLAQPKLHFFLKPMVTRRAFAAYGLPYTYVPRPNAVSYAGLLALTRAIKRDLADMRPRDQIDIQSFLWVQGSDEYPD